MSRNFLTSTLQTLLRKKQDPALELVHATDLLDDVDVNAPDLAEGDALSDLAQLPPFERVLTVPGGELALGESQRGMLAVIRISKTNAVILVKPSAQNTNEHLSLLQRARKRYAMVTSLTVRGSLLLSLYTQESNGVRIRTERVQGEEALASSTFAEMAERGVRERASDLHVEVSEESGIALLRYRIDGQLLLLDTIPALHALEAVGFAYTKLAEKSSRSDPSFNRRVSQICNIPLNIEGEEYTLRWQSTPRVGGMEVVFRILETRANSHIPTLAELGLESGQQEDLSLMVRSKGAIIIVGETGSGKSTTLRTLQDIYPHRERKKIISLEQPVEYRKSGVTEISVQASVAGNDDPFVTAMRDSLRLDPDLILPGEIRDKETASLFQAMVQGGHKVITTLHCGSSIEALHRLSSDQIGVSRQVLGSRDFMVGVVYQKLVATLCTCKIPARANLDAKTGQLLEQKFSLNLDTMYVAKPDGCPHCRSTGFKGRTLVAEILPVTRQFLELIRHGRDGDIEELWRQSRTARFDDPDMKGKTVFEHGLYKVHQGVVDPVELSSELSMPYELYEVVPTRNELKAVA